MIRKTTLGVAIVAVLGLALVGCSDDDNGAGGSGGTAGSGGSAGTGGTGGGDLGGGTITAVHLAPEFPTMMDTDVEIFLDGEGLGVTIDYASSTGRVELPAGDYMVGLGIPGADEPALELAVTIEDGSDFTAVAYRITDENLPVSVLVFDTSSEGLASGEARLFVGHGANDPALDPVNIVTVDGPPVTECGELIPGFAFGTIFPATGVADFDAPPDASVQIGFNVTEDCPPVFEDLAVTVPLTADVVTVGVAVDEDLTDGLAPQLYGMIDAGQPVPLIPIPTE